MPPHVLVDFVVFPPGHGRSVTDFWGWDAHEAQLRCPHGMSGDIGRCSARRALKHKFYQLTQTVVTAGILPFRENSYGWAGNRTRDLMISCQRLWPIDHEAGHVVKCIKESFITVICPSLVQKIFPPLCRAKSKWNYISWLSVKFFSRDWSL